MFAHERTKLAAVFTLNPKPLTTLVREGSARSLAAMAQPSRHFVAVTSGTQESSAVVEVS